MSSKFELMLAILLNELNLKQLGKRENQVFDDLTKAQLLIGYHTTEVVAAITFYTQRELGNYVDMARVCKEIGAIKTGVFRLVGKITRHYGTSYIISNPSVVSRVEAITNQMDLKKSHDSYFNLLLEGFNKYELIANEHGLHKGRGYYAAITYLLLKPKGYTQADICDYVNATCVSIRNNLKQIKGILEL